ncbi:MAG: glycosyltransferase family 4 protein [Deltaproteobacteria bacterium]|nr:glycosyltransferase family 4 protein [Deltaproteobacteria bacterium]
MKIGIISEYYYPYLGGIAEHVHNTWRQFRARGHDVTIVTPEMKGLRYGAGVTRGAGWAQESEIIRIGSSRPFYFNDGFVRLTSPFGLVRRLREVFRSERFDLVHVHAPLVPMLPMAAIKAADCPVVGTCHTETSGNTAYRVANVWFWRFADRLDGCIAVSPVAAEAMERHFGLSCTIVPNGVDTALYRPGNRPAAGFADGRRNVLFVGRFDPHNGLKFLLEAFPLVKNQVPDARLVVVGDGPLRKSYERLVPPSIAGDVHFLGMQYLRKPELYACADVFVNPALYHAQGIVCLEAMASGTPIVASAIRGFEWLMQDDAVYAEPGNSAALASAIIETLSDANRAADLRRRVRARAERLSWEVVSGRILDYFGSVIGGTAPDRERSQHAERSVHRQGAPQPVH